MPVMGLPQVSFHPVPTLPGPCPTYGRKSLITFELSSVRNLRIYKALLVPQRHDSLYHIHVHLQHVLYETV
jgi:hypothetical protein